MVNLKIAFAIFLTVLNRTPHASVLTHFFFIHYSDIIFCMNKIDVKCVALEGAIIPEYKTVGAAGADVYAFLKESVTLAVGKSCVIPTGVFYEIPEGFEIKNLGSKVKNLVVRLCDEDEYRLTDSLMSKFFIQEILIAVKLLAKTINAQGVLFVVNKKFENLKPAVFFNRLISRDEKAQ